MPDKEGWTGVVATLYYPEFEYRGNSQFRINVGSNVASVMFLDYEGAQKLIAELQKVKKGDDD